MTDRLTDADLAAIRERCEKATPGPWAFEAFPDDGTGFRADQFWADGKIGGSDREAVVWVPMFPDDEPDAEFIAHAREDIPRLLAEVERLREERGDQAAEIARHHADFGRWEDMAARGAEHVAENRELKAEVERLRKVARHD